MHCSAKSHKLIAFPCRLPPLLVQSGKRNILLLKRCFAMVWASKSGSFLPVLLPCAFKLNLNLFPGKRKTWSSSNGFIHIVGPEIYWLYPWLHWWLQLIPIQPVIIIIHRILIFSHLLVKIIITCLRPLEPRYGVATVSNTEINS